MYLIANGSINGYLKNTKEGILLSKFNDKINGVLIDVRMTNDDKLVLSENDLIFKNYYISKMNYQDLKRINIGNKIDNYYIPLLEDILLYYDKEILIIKLHHNYDENEKLVLKLKRILDKYYIKRLIIISDNDNLYDYLKLLTKYEIYDLKREDIFILGSISSINYNNRIVSNIIYDEKKLQLLKQSSNNIENIFIIVS